MGTRRQRVKVVALVAWAIGFGAIGVSGCGDGTTTIEGADDAMGLYGMEEPLVDGAEFDFGSLEGGDAVLWFWTPWCVPCQTDAAAVAALHHDFPDVAVVAVGGKGGEHEYGPFLANFGEDPPPVVIDTDLSVWAEFGVIDQPAFVLVRANGTAVVAPGDAAGIRDRLSP